MKKFDIIQKEMISILTTELNEKVKQMRMRYALWEGGCLLANSDHGPCGAPYLMPRLHIERIRIYTGTREAGSYNHHSQMTKFQGKYYFAWSNGIIDEEAEGQRIMISSSDDGRHWATAKCIISGDVEKGLLHNCVGLYSSGKELIIYCWTESAIRDAELPGMRRIVAGSAYIDTYISPDGKRWSLKEKAITTEGTVSPESECGMIFESPRLTKEGLLLAGGTYKNRPVAYRWDAKNPAGRPEVITMPLPSKEAVFPYGEATWYQTDDGVIIMFWRDEGASEHLYINFSEDGGKTWSVPLLSDFPDSMSRVYAGRLSDGRFYLIGNSYPKLLDRMHLMISISDDGYKFNKMYCLIDDPTAQRTKGLLKLHGYQYPCSLVDGNNLLIGYSVNKEDIELGIVDISNL